MNLEKTSDVVDYDKQDHEEFWRVDDWEWKNWRTASRDMDLAGYMAKQRDFITGIQTREFFITSEGRQPKNDDELGDFFMAHNGSKYFQQRYFQHRVDVPEEKIISFYTELEKNIAS